MKNVMTSLKSIRWIIVTFACVQFTAFQAQAYYNPQTGRWLSRDPIGEPGFQVLRLQTHCPEWATLFLYRPAGLSAAIQSPCEEAGICMDSFTTIL